MIGNRNKKMRAKELADQEKAQAVADQAELEQEMDQQAFEISAPRVPQPDNLDMLWKFGNQKKYYQDAMCDYS